MQKLVLRPTSALQQQQGGFRINYANELNEAQYRAVMHTNGAALVVAGAGTGKTRTLTYRVARLVESGISPQSILLLTFTRKAAAEILRRAGAILDGRCSQVSGGTFHSFASSELRRYASLLGFESNFSLLDQTDAEDVVDLVRTSILGNAKRRFPRKQTLASIISSSRNCLLSISDSILNDYPQFVEELTDIERIADAYRIYKKRHNLMDYDDLLFFFAALCDQSPEVRQKLHAQYRYVMVDEYQDTNRLQHEIVKSLAGESENVMAVGDDAQSIYSFRGADVRNILEFPDSFSQCEIIKLEQNYRSTQPILNSANALITASGYSYQKELVSTRENAEGPAPMIICAANEQQQSQFVVQQILDLREENVSLEEIAVLFRSGFHSFDLELELTRANIPFRKFGGLKLMETAHIKDIIAHLRVLINPRDAVSWFRILRLLEGVGPKTAQLVVDAISQNEVTLQSVAWLSSIPRGAEPVKKLFEMLRKTSNEKIAFVEKVVRIVEWYRPLMKRNYEDYTKRTKDVETFLTLTDRYESLEQMLAELALDPPTESVEEIDGVSPETEFLTLSTVHSSKGLEWKAVFIIWALDGRFPPVRSFENDASLEEERRLMYVAVTRAKRYLFITYPVGIYDRESGMVLGRPSRFFDAVNDSLAGRYALSAGV